MAGQARQRAVAIAITVVVVATAGIALIAPSASAQASAGIQVQAGINDPKDPNIAVLEFMPKSVTVATGATVTWD